jgi:hypothetical protein
MEIKLFGGVLTVVAPVTLMVAVPVALTVPTLAVIEAVPGATAFSMPLALTVATLALEVAQVAELVTSAWLPSLYFPTAVNCWAAPTFKDAPFGVRAMEVKVVSTLGTGELFWLPGDAPEPPHPTTIIRSRKRTGSSHEAGARECNGYLSNSELFSFGCRVHGQSC